MTSLEISPFDASKYLDSEEKIVAYLNAIIEEGNPELIPVALGTVAKARGMTEIAKLSGLGRESLYKATTEGSKPRFDTIIKVAKAIGVKINFQIEHTS